MKLAEKIGRLLVARYFAEQSEHERKAAARRLVEIAEFAQQGEPPEFAQQLERWLRPIRDDLIPRAPPGLDAWVERAITRPALLDWATAQIDPAELGIGVEAFGRRVMDWFAGLSAADQAEFIGAALRRKIGQTIESDQERRARFLEALNPNKEMSIMAPQQAQPQGINFAPDTRGLPASLTDFPNGPGWTAWYTALSNGIANFGLAYDPNDTTSVATYAAITGMMLYDGQTDQTNAAFQPALQRIWIEAMGSTVPAPNQGLANPLPNRTLYAIIAAQMAQSNNNTVLFQQLSYVARFAIQHAPDVPAGSPLFTSQITVAMNQYVAGPPPAESLDLPPLLGGSIQDAELDPTNMQIFSLVYAIAQGEEFGTFRTVDTLAENWVNGLLATQFDTGGKLLDNWFWTRKDRMTEAERRMMYTRMLGMAGGEVPKDIQPNTEFNDRFWTFLAAIAEFDRQTRIADLFTGSLAGNSGQSLAMTMENVRQKGHDLGANMTVYAYGYPHYGARRANDDFTNAFSILQNPIIQNILGVTTPYQVIERTYIANYGKAPDIVRLRTMAVSGKAVLDIVARNAPAWTNQTGLPLFPNPYLPLPAGVGAAVGAAIQTAINLADTIALIQNTNLILATNGVQYSDIDKKSQPQLVPYSPSLPALSGLSPTASTGANGSGAMMDKIKQMVSAGQTPSIDQLKALLPAGYTV